jgi:hypothetical protein
MAHIRVHCLGARDREKGGAEHGEGDAGSCVDEVLAAVRIRINLAEMTDR